MNDSNVDQSNVGVLQNTQVTNKYHIILKSQTKNKVKIFQIEGVDIEPYVGPDHELIDDLIQLMEQKERQVPEYQIIQNIYDLINIVEQWFEAKCTFWNGQIKITPTFVLIILIHLIVFMVYLFQSLDLLTNSVVKDSTWRYYIVSNMPQYGMMFTAFTLIFLNVQNSIIIILSFLLFFVAPLLILLFYSLSITNTSNSNYDLGTIMGLSVCAATFLNAYFVNSLYRWLNTMIKEIFSAVLVSSWCIIFPFFVGFYVIAYILTSQLIYFTSVANYIAATLTVPLIFLLIGSWVAIKARLFDLPPLLIRNIMERLKVKIESRIIRSVEHEQRLGWFHRHAKLLTAYLIGAVYLMLEIWMFVELSYQLSYETISFQIVITLFFEIMGIPIFLIFGVFVAVSDRNITETMLYVPLFFGLIPILVFIKLGLYLNDYVAVDSILYVLMVLPVFTLVVWLTLALFGLERRRLQLFIMGYMCYFFAIPIGVMYPLYNLTQNTALQVGYYILICIGILGLLILFINYLYETFQIGIQLRKISLEVNPSFEEFSQYYWTEYAIWLNAMFFIISYFIIGYFFWQAYDNIDESDTDSEKGTLYALLIIHPVLFILIHNALQQPSLENSSNQVLSLELAQSLNKRQNVIAIIGVVLPLCIFVPLSFTTSSVYQYACLGIALGLPLCFAIYKILTWIKNQSYQYQHQLQPFVSSISWCCIIFPFGVVVPALSAYYINTSSQFKLVAQAAVGGGLMVFIFGVTATSLLIFIILNKEEFERKKNFIVGQLLKKFQELLYDGQTSTVAQIYLKYVDIYYKIARNARTKEHQLKIKDSTKAVLYEKLYHNDPIYYIDEKQVNPINNSEEWIIGRLITKMQYLNLEKEQEKSQRIKRYKDIFMMFCQYFIDCLICKCGLALEEEPIQDKQLQGIDEELSKLVQELKNEDEANNILPPMAAYKRAQGPQNIVQVIDLTAEQRLFTNPLAHIKDDQIKSSKTHILQNIQKKTSLSKLGEYGQSLKSSDQQVVDFLHEVFMEFANEDQGLEPSICYLDFLEFQRLSELNFQKQEFYRFANNTWLNQNKSLNELDFAKLLSSILKEYDGAPFENLRKMVIDIMYPNLITNLPSLMKNLKFQNRKILDKLQKETRSPFNPDIFNNPKIINSFQPEISQVQQRQINTSKQDSPEKRRKKIIKEKIQQRQELLEQLKKEQIIIKPELNCCLRNVYSCAQWFRKYICYCFYKKEEKVPEPIQQIQQLLGKGKSLRKHEKWDIAIKEVIDEIFVAEEQYLHQNPKKNFVFNRTASNYAAALFRLVDIYSIAALAITSQIGWFGSSSVNLSETTDGSSFGIDYVYQFYVALGATVVYGILGRIAIERINDGTFGKDSQGETAILPHPQALLALVIILISGQFIRFMSLFIEAFICNYQSTIYTLSKDSSIECFSQYHFILIALSLIGVGIYYPLSSFLQPIFQFNDQTLDLKFDTKFQVLYTQCKLLLVAVSLLFQSVTGSLIYQLGFSIIILMLLIIIHIRMEPCYVENYNIIEQSLLLFVIGIYIGAFIIVLTGSNIIGLIFTGIFSVILVACLVIYNQRKQIFTFQIVPSNESFDFSRDEKLKIFQIKIPKKNKVPIVESPILENVREEPKQNIIRPLPVPLEGSRLIDQVVNLEEVQGNKKLKEKAKQ